MNRALLAMLPSEVEQLRQLGEKALGVEHGDVISKATCAALIEKGYAERTVHFYCATDEGRRWLRCAGLLPWGDMAPWERK